MAEKTPQALKSSLRERSALLQSREELLKTFIKNAPAGVAMFDRDMRYLQVSDRWCADYSVDSSLILGRSQYELFPDIPSHWKDLHRRGLQGEILKADEERWDRKGGTKWVRWEIRPWWGLDKMPAGILIFAEDITLLKQLEETLFNVTRKLIEAQEQERVRIGRELHDDTMQKLALLAIDIERITGGSTDIKRRLKGLRAKVDEISDDIRALSHDLHAASLEYVGVVDGIANWCTDFGERHKILITFSSDVQTRLPHQIGISLFRIVQAALQNALKHSGTTRVEISFVERSNEIHLLIHDFGRGFEVDDVRGGLGLISMRERARLIGGSLIIDAKRERGTSIEVRVPLRESGNVRGK
jgi:PAS domain S-box-containing protein